MNDLLMNWTNLLLRFLEIQQTETSPNELFRLIAWEGFLNWPQYDSSIKKKNVVLKPQESFLKLEFIFSF